MKINIKKTKTMRISKGKERTVKITIDGKELEQVGKFCYPGILLPRKYDHKIMTQSVM